MWLPWKMPKVDQFRHMRVMFSIKNTKTNESFDLEAEMLKQIEEDSEQEPEAVAEVSLPNLVNLMVSTPTKADTEIKQEPVSMSSVPTSLPALVTEENRKRTRSPKPIQSWDHLPSVMSEVTQSVTLESETRSADTSHEMLTDYSDACGVRTPTPPMESSPPQKIRRSARNAHKN